MSTKVAPWLQGLSDEGWEVPKQRTLSSSVSSASHNASSLQGSRSRIPRRSLSGLPSSLSRRTSTSSTQKKRNPLGSLTNNDTNTLGQRNTSTNLSGARSVSQASDGSLAACGTVQQRSKSASPKKNQETLEWKKRLLHGQLGYGDQTDLFGPSGLENIFSNTAKGTENDVLNPKDRMGWLQKSDLPMPSSPPPWPSSLMDQVQNENHAGRETLDAVNEEGPLEISRVENDEFEDSFRSNPFDLESVDQHLPSYAQDSPRQDDQMPSSPNKAFIEPSGEEPVGNRTVSGQTELEQEDFSPVFITKHHTITGQVDYAALDSHTMKQFRTTNVDLRHTSQEQSADCREDDAEERDEICNQSTFSDGPGTQAQPDLSFSENLPTGSPFPNLGKHVELKRGGYSQYGSFKRKPLSPSQSISATNNVEASGLLSPIFSESVSRPPAPTPPRTPGGSVNVDDPKSKSSGSPLKLFGAHDTFTNNRLLRRISQLNPDGTVRQSTEAPARYNGETRRVQSSGSFGNGELDEHQFDAEITITSASDEEDPDSEGSPGSEIPVPGSKTPAAFRFDHSPHITETYKLKRKLSKHSTATSKGSIQYVTMHATVEEVSELHLRPVSGTESKRNMAENKRPPTSPFKSPTPKRRRTLHASELEDYMVRVNDTYHSQLQEAVSSRKRKDARQGDAQVMAGPDVLASRKILLPKNPTSIQRRRQQIEAQLREAAEEFAEQEPEKLEAVLEQIESSLASDVPRTVQQRAEAVASEVAAFTLRVQRPSGEQGERKRSVTTQDFLDEAMMVMNLIRAKARPQSNLGSVEESEGEAFNQGLRADGSRPDESLSVSRPPSREHTGWRQRGAFQTDARVVSHLRRFKESDERDETDFIAGSAVSLHVDDEVVNDGVLIMDEQSNIRITGPPSDKGKRTNESDSRPQSQRSQSSTLDTHNSNGTSTGRTADTSSTRKSDNVGTLAPDAVAHLIGEQVGGMTFDKEQQRWVRVSKSPVKTHGSFLELPSTVTSDDDPFREISDLPVDVQNEMRRISSPGKTGEGAPQAGEQPSDTLAGGREEEHKNAVEVRTSSQETVISRPVTRDGPRIQHIHSSSVPSKYTAFASSQQQEKIETRATSWSDEELARMSAYGKARKQPLAYAAAQAELSRQHVLEENEEESSETVTGTVPTDEVDANIERESEDLVAETVLDLEEDNVEAFAPPKLRQTPAKPTFQPQIYRTGTRQVSLRRQTLTNRMRPEALEHSEVSFVAPLPGDRMVSVSLSVSRPVSSRIQALNKNELQSSPSRGNSSFILSDLPDFTVHEDDGEQRPSERALATRLAHHAAVEVNDRYALAVKGLVKTLTDIHEDEPYWEDLKQLDLHDRSIDSLYGLSDFCGRVQSMDVSQNALTHLQGVPCTARRLNVRSNRLSDLTPWDHLPNLQYLDVSHNDLESLDGLGSLIHLRELRADDNMIAKLDGLFELDGLLSVRLRRNTVCEVDFTGCQLHQLTSLDLSQNPLTSLKGLECLSSLKELKLEEADLPDGLDVEQEMPNLRALCMRNCNVKHLNIAKFPNLQQLIMDDNQLSSVQGLSQLKHLELLSMKRQTLAKGDRLRLFDHTFDAHTVRVSGNALPSMDVAANFLSVRHLELASVGLQKLPDDFGLRLPNLRTLNLNYNSLKDVRPVLNINNLEHLSICGNHLHRLRKSVATFAKMTSLRTLDLRDNQLTKGFYPNIASTLCKNTSLVRVARHVDVEDEDVNAATDESARYEYPAADAEQDVQHRTRLDKDTMLRRRVHEMLLTHGCPSLQSLDGLPLDGGVANERDAIWDRLLELGVLKRSQRSDDRSIDRLYDITDGRET